jgi:hypothetical protein
MEDSMHPEIVRTMAEQQIEQWLASAEADRMARQNRSHRSRRRLRRRSIATGSRAAQCA